MKAIVVATASVLVLAACATPEQPSTLRSGGSAPFSATNPNVYIVSVDSQVHLVVDQEPLRFAANTGTKKIKWKLRDSAYKLDRVEIKPDNQGRNPSTGCAGDNADDSVFECHNDTSVVGSFKYLIRAIPKQSGLPTPPELDPWVVNN